MAWTLLSNLVNFPMTLLTLDLLESSAEINKIVFHYKSFLVFRSSHFSFLVTFDDEVTKTRKFYVIFVYILQGKMGKTGKNQKEIHATKVTKIPKTKRRKYGMNETKVIFV